MKDLWAPILIIAMMLGFFVWLIWFTYDPYGYEIIDINGMPCVVTDSGISCDWSKYDG